MKKIFHHENQTELSEIHFHDSVFGNFCYDHFDGTITVTCESECEEKNYTILFKNVIYFEMIINKQAAIHTIAWVRMPASLLRVFLSTPIMTPQMMDTTRRTTKCQTSLFQSTT